MQGLGGTDFGMSENERQVLRSKDSRDSRDSRGSRGSKGSRGSRGGEGRYQWFLIACKWEICPYFLTLSCLTTFLKPF